ncbi:MAG: lipopolysaccharide biosynthesis protein [bacterium]
MNRPVDFPQDYFDEETRSISDYLAILGRRRKPAIITFGILVVLAIALALNLPAVYRSTAVILIEQQEIPKGLVESTVTGYADQRIQVINQRVMTSANLLSLINKYDLYPEERKKYPPEQVIEMLRENIKLEMVSADVIDPRSGRPMAATIAFSLGYESESPKKAQEVANELTTLYLNENVQARRRSTTDTADFLSSEAKKLENQISTLEKRLATFKQENQGSLPEQVDLNTRMMDRAERDLDAVDRDLRAIDERKIYLTGELATLDPSIPDGRRMRPDAYDPDLKLQALQSEYVTKLAKYSDDHPDVQKLKKEIAALGGGDGQGVSALLEAELATARSRLAELQERYGPEHPDVKRQQRKVVALEKSASSSSSYSPSVSMRANPAYVNIKTQLQSADVDKQSLLTKRAQLEAKLNKLESQLNNTPRVEQEYRDLTRDYENASSKYQEIRAKQLEARLAQSLEADNKGERFTLIEPPLLPEIPIKPNRPAIIVLGLLLAIGAGLGVAFLLETMDSSITSRHALMAVTGAAPIAVIPKLVDLEEESKRKRRTVLSLILVSVILVGVALAIIHVAYMPLDVLFIRLGRVLEMKFG